MRKQTILFAGLVLMAAVAAADAQSPPSVATPPSANPPTESGACPPAQQVPSQQGGATTGKNGSTQNGTTGQDLGDKLAQSNGVLCPPQGVDPAIRAPTPDTGRMPVIPPPGSPGGNPNIQPK